MLWWPQQWMWFCHDCDACVVYLCRELCEARFAAESSTPEADGATPKAEGATPKAGQVEGGDAGEGQVEMAVDEEDWW